MFTIDASKIRSLMFEHNVSGVYDLARKAKLNELTASKVLKDGAVVTAKTISALAKFFGINGNDLILKKE
ncbi:helix-turn-helix domain-containing protein [Ralstonia pseudosolanacearum]|uniref:helix-turn-helix domain-containing protein n=1 Tax=Ralstonia pseudosolanacearum TaxID=1310165 RepID=UPI003CFA4D42